MIQEKTQRPVGSTQALALGVLLAALLAISMVLATKPAHADTTFTVTNTADPGNGVCDVVCTLREAITAANDTAGKDTINFRLSNTGEVRTITPASELPEITEAVTIDGYTQLGSSPNTLDKGTNAVLKVQLDGTSAGPNASGLTTGSSASNVVVRGLVINGFDFTGVELLGNSSKVEGNFIGTDPSGTLDRGNGSFGGVLVHGDSNTVGGTSRLQRNLISGNGEGVDLNVTAAGNKVQGNLIGTGKDGTSDLGNDRFGVAMVDADRNLIGGTGLGEANTIAFNGDDGVFVVSFSSDLDATGNRILANSIFSNGGLGIDLRGGTENAAGATANDKSDSDEGPNGLQNKPVVTSATNSAGKTTIQGKLNSTWRDPFLIQFFFNPSDQNEGRQLIGTKSVSTNSDGNVSFTFLSSKRVGAGKTVTATATDVVGANTSEFSAPRTVVAQ